MKISSMCRAASMEAAVALAMSVSVLCAFGQERSGAPAPACGSGAFLTFEQGKLAAVNWVERTGKQVRSRAVLNQSQIVDATIDVLADETAVHSSVTLSTAGEASGPSPSARDLGAGAIYWTPRLASSIEQAILRARVINKPRTEIPGASLFSPARPAITVERVDPTDWVVGYQDKKYLVLTDEHGCMTSAEMPDYGVVIERRANFSEAEYRPWPPYGAPPDDPYRAENVSISAPQGHVLAGTLTVPNSKGPSPAAVLITGLSPHERNNGDAPWVTFRDVADTLTRAGIAVLRVDDRGVGKSTGDRKTFTSFDKTDDVLTEVAWLRKHAGIDPQRIMLLGYSEGGLIAPMAAAKDSAIAAVVTLAGPGVPGMEVARYQVEQPILRDTKLTAAARDQQIAKEFAEALKDLSAHESSFLKIDPIVYDRQVRCPALIIQGATDATVPVRSAERIAAAMRAGGNADVTVRIFPGISHSLLPDPGGLSSGWVALPAFLTAPELLDEVARWSVARLMPGNRK